MSQRSESREWLRLLDDLSPGDTVRVIWNIGGVGYEVKGAFQSICKFQSGRYGLEIARHGMYSGGFLIPTRAIMRLERIATLQATSRISADGNL